MSNAGPRTQQTTDQFEYHLASHLRLSGLYWSLTALELLNNLSALPRGEVIEFVKSCQNKKDGGFGGEPGMDSHLLYTLSAVQVLAILDGLEEVDGEQVAGCGFLEGKRVIRLSEFDNASSLYGRPTFSDILSLAQPDGSFMGDKWGEIDARFCYCALQAMTILGKLDQLDTDKIVEYLKGLINFDGGFGNVKGAESHAGHSMF